MVEGYFMNIKIYKIKWKCWILGVEKLYMKIKFRVIEVIIKVRIGRSVIGF